jgi:flagellar biogenesis protein FliO
MKWIYLFFFPLLIVSADLPEAQKTEPPVSEELQPAPEESVPSLSPDIYRKQFYRTLIFIIAIIVIALLLIWWMRKFSKNQTFQANHKKNIKILERRQVSPSTFLYHIQIGSKQVIISESKCDVRLITTLDFEETDLPTN